MLLGQAKPTVQTIEVFEMSKQTEAGFLQYQALHLTAIPRRSIGAGGLGR